MTKLRVKEFISERVHINTLEFEMPNTPVYFYDEEELCWTKVIPIFTKFWNKEKGKEEENLNRLGVIRAHTHAKAVIERFDIPTYRLEYIYNTEEHEYNILVSFLIHEELTDLLKSEFYAAFNETLEKIKKTTI